MTTAIKRRRGTTTQHSTFTGLEGEITVDSTKDTVVVHDGSTAGGFALLREDLSNNTNVITATNTKTLTNKTVDLASNTLTGTTAQFNAALSDNDFATLAGTETLSNKTFSTNPTISSGTANGVAYLNGSKVLTTGSTLTFDGSNLGLGVTPSAWYSAAYSKALQIGSYAGVSCDSFGSSVITNNAYESTTSQVWKYLSTNAASRYAAAFGSHSWFTAPSGTAGNAISFTQAMTLDASGNLLVGKTSADDSSIGVECRPIGFISSIRSSGASANFRRNTTTGDIVTLLYGSTTVGSISTNGTGVTYGTSSDYRLKENIQPMQNALATIAQLNPVTYNWKADGSDGQGFIAHELQAVVPDCVTGEKDAVDKDGKPVYQGIDTSFLVATLTKAIQEQQDQINQLTARVAQLEGK